MKEVGKSGLKYETLTEEERLNHKNKFSYTKPGELQIADSICEFCIYKTVCGYASKLDLGCDKFKGENILDPKCDSCVNKCNCDKEEEYRKEFTYNDNVKCQEYAVKIPE